MGLPCRTNGEYRSLRIFFAFSDVVPTTTRSGFIKSSTASPSRKNSGLATMSNSTLQLAAMAFCTFPAVPGGTVLLSMITLYSLMILPSSPATFSTAERSADPSCPGGVGNARKISVESFTASGRLVVNFNRFSRRLRMNNFSSPGS